MTTFTDVIRKAANELAQDSKSSRPFLIKKADQEKMIVYGEVYAPEVVDSHGDAMTAEEIEKLAHLFLIEMRNHNIDLQHNNKPVQASVVESFIAREGDPIYTPGAWVMGTKIFDEDLWADIKKGVYNGYSMEVLVNKKKETVTVLIQNDLFGYTVVNDGHEHAFYVKMSDDGRVIGGRTSYDDGHYHEIKYGTATEEENGHSHRYVLP